MADEQQQSQQQQQPTKSIQFFVKLPNNKTQTLQFPNCHPITPQSIKQKLNSPQTLTLILNGKILSDPTTPIKPSLLSLSTLALSVPIKGGKGGFGSLLRGAATKAGQKKTSNFDACRDMSGRRLRHVNAEKRMEEWKAEEGERRLEKVAEEFLKKMVKKKGGKGGEREKLAEKYVEEYREASAKCVEVVERSVRESLGGGGGNSKKRKALEKLKKKVDDDGAKKKLKIWMGKRKINESDSDASDEDDSEDSDTEIEKSTVIDNGNHSDPGKSASSGSVPGSLMGGSSDSSSEGEKETVIGGSVGSAGNSLEDAPADLDNSVDTSSEAEENLMIHRDSMCAAEELVSTSAEIAVEKDVNVHEGPQLSSVVPEAPSECKSASPVEDIVTETSDVPEVLQPLNFDDYNTASELEVLGMERLKSELQSRGLKCGGTLQERAARLFLLKTTPLENLPRKLLAKK